MAEAITIARPYATAVYRLAKENNTLTSWSDMLSFAALLSKNEQMAALIENPKLSKDEVESSFLKVAGDKLNAQATNLVKLLVEYHRLPLIGLISEAFEALKAEDEGVLEAQITAASQPSPEEVQAIVQRLQAKFGKKIEASVKIDPAVIGGVKIEVGDTVIDASVRGQLQQMAYALQK